MAAPEPVAASVATPVDVRLVVPALLGARGAAAVGRERGASWG